MPLIDLLKGRFHIVAAFIVAGLNWRFGWCVLPDWGVLVSAVVFLACYLLYAEVLRENTYLSRTIEVQENQKVKRCLLWKIITSKNYFPCLLLARGTRKIMLSLGFIKK